jgi:hypothetical protein
MKHFRLISFICFLLTPALFAWSQTRPAGVPAAQGASGSVAEPKATAKEHTNKSDRVLDDCTDIDAGTYACCYPKEPNNCTCCVKGNACCYDADSHTPWCAKKDKDCKASTASTRDGINIKDKLNIFADASDQIARSKKSE